ncbi:MAG: 4'-phosphopantetheinyl transferase family protein, partial [Saprospiraceae bacterium]
SDFFKAELSLTKEEKNALVETHPKRQMEWMAGRLLLHKMSGRKTRGECTKDEFGKPFLKDSEYDISLSHSGRFAAVIATPFPCGIDIQKIVPKLKRIENKFMTKADLSTLSTEFYMEHLHVYWGAKEAIYKAYGKKKLEFKEHILLDSFEYDVTFGKCKGYVRKESVRMDFDIHYRKIENYILVYAIEQK